MGMSNAFIWTIADFSGISTNAGLFIDDIKHSTFISVDEAGTEAAAATVILMPPGSQHTIELTVDRPFIFLIRDIETEQILFIGRVLNPGI